MGTGVYTATKKDGTIYYRSSITYKSKHISLGSATTYEKANAKYELATSILRHRKYDITDYNHKLHCLDFEKWVILMNFRDNGMYIKTPIYLYKKYFKYYVTQNTVLTFDADDLFFYSHHKIFRKGNYLFVNDFGMQMNILTRYGIKNYASKGKDYVFIDGNSFNFRYDNIDILNPYTGVERILRNNQYVYKAKIHVNGYITIGYFHSIHKAAIAYNKAVDFMKRYVVPGKNYTSNYVDAISKDEIELYYTSIKLPANLIKLVEKSFLKA